MQRFLYEKALTKVIKITDYCTQINNQEIFIEGYYMRIFRVVKKPTTYWVFWVLSKKTVFLKVALEYDFLLFCKVRAYKS